ncbi:histone acetyltransferase esa1 [Vairimorpha apis BRL 01]|uniref:Histone acetyltransferase n=1 Tax=Vairimorpha apis BRL 01 TaxID=1037528 RepID=T0MAH4_9MICR|nr:histone acetyltransferase esa1 [Vairimorpha apis BRL 01]
MKNSLKYKDFKNNNIDEYILNLFDKEANKRKKIEESESYDSFNQKIINLFIGKRKFEITNNLFNFYKSSTLYVCNDCLELYDLEISFKRHIKKCSKIIAGSYVVYHDENIKILKIQGLDNISICQNICNIGYFSEEILNSDNNLSCITIFPDFQKKGYGLLLVDFSYYLKKGTCEKPLSQIYNKYSRRFEYE